MKGVFQKHKKGDNDDTDFSFKRPSIPDFYILGAMDLSVFIRNGVNAIQNIFGTSCRPFFTGLTMGTYLNWQREKKSGKTDNETFSVSHSGEIPHGPFFG